MELNKSIDVHLGPIKGKVFGGPYKRFVPGTRRLIGVKMAAEIRHQHDISIPTEDYSIPSVEDMTAGIISAMGLMAKGNDIYVGCMGGIGRTGLFMGCLVKVMDDWAKANGEPTYGDPVGYVRSAYLGHAIETDEQQRFVREFDSKPVLDWLNHITAPVVVKVPMTLRETIKYLFGIA